MKIFSSLHLLAALGVLGAAGARVGAGRHVAVEVHVVPVSEGDHRQRRRRRSATSPTSRRSSATTPASTTQGAFAILGGSVSRRGDDGYYADLWGRDLGLDSRSLYGRGGREGRYTLRVGYAEIPRHLTEGASTPFLGSGGALLGLPPGFPAADTASMPLAATLQPIDIGYKYKRLDLGGTVVGGRGLELPPRACATTSATAPSRPRARSSRPHRSSSRRSTRRPTRSRSAVAYATRQLQATLGYHVLVVPQRQLRLTWSNPFFPVVRRRDDRPARARARQPVPAAARNGGLRHHADDPPERRARVRPHDAGRRLPARRR